VATEEEAALRRLEASEARFRLLAESATDVVMQVDLRDGIQFVSPSVRRYGYEPEDMIGRTGASFIHPEDLATVLDRVDRIAAGEPRDPNADTSYRVLTADGGHTWMEGNTAVIRDEFGEPVGLISHLRDVSERRAANAALAESEARYRLLADAATDVVLKVDPDDVIKYVSPSARRYGYEPEDLIGRAGFSLVHPDDVGKVRAIIADLFEKAEVDPARDRTYRVRKADGEYVWMEGNPALVRNPDGKVRSVISQLRDVSERVAALSLLADSELRYRLIAEKATDIISRTGADSRVIFVSPSVRDITGHAAEDLVGRSLLAHIHPEDVPHVLESYRQIVDGERQEGTPLSYRARHKDGRWIWLECNPTPMRDAAGKVVEFIDVTRDVSARKLIEAELLAARDAAEAAAAVKADFMANMSHEIRTPLTAILGFTSLIAARSDLAVDAQGQVHRITTAGKALLAIVNDILDFSKLEAGLMPIQPKPASPLELLSDALAMFEPQAHARRLTLRLEGATRLPAHLSLDPDRVRQVLLNLIGNAIKFSEQGEITVAAKYDRKAARLRVSVQDCGVGMDADQQAKLFQRFSQVDASSTRRHGGTGLGLAICRGLVEAMGGEIGVDSTVGTGSVFSFDVKAPVCASPTVTDHTPGAAGVAGLRLLVADDNPINRELARAILTPFGIEVAEAEDGLAAVEMAMAMPYDVLLLDIRMPGLDGPEVAQRVRSQSGPNRDVPILAFSADYDMERFGEQAVRCFDGFVRKPMEPAALIEMLALVTSGVDELIDQERPHGPVG